MDVCILTAKTFQDVLDQGGSCSWKANPSRLRDCAHAVLTRNRHTSWGRGTEPHRSAFMVGKVSGVVPAPEYPGRWLVQFSEFAQLDIPDVWQKGRFPLAYADISEILPNVDLTTLNWERMPPPANPFPVIPPGTHGNIDADEDEVQTADLSDLPEVVACRARLAAELGIAPDKLGLIAEVLGGRLRFHI